MRRFYPLILIALGLLTIAGTYAGFVLAWNNGMNAGFAITVPDAVDVDLGRDAPEHAVWQELVGPHVTLNRPLLPQPDDLAITITDRRTGEPVAPLEEGGLRSQQEILPGLVRDRRTIVYFTPPAHGEIRVEVSGAFDYEQPYRIAPGMRDLAIAAKRYVFLGPVIGSVLVLVGIGVFIVRAMRAESRLDLTR